MSKYHRRWGGYIPGEEDGCEKWERGHTPTPNFIIKHYRLVASEKDFMMIQHLQVYNYDYPGWICNPTQSQLAEDMRLSKSQVKRRIRSMRNNKLIKVTKCGRQNQYSFTPFTEKVVRAAGYDPEKLAEDDLNTE